MEEVIKDKCRCVICGKSLKLNTISVRNHINTHIRVLTPEEGELYVFMSMNENPRELIRCGSSTDIPDSVLRLPAVAAFRSSTELYRRSLVKIKKYNKVKVRKKTKWKPRVRRKNPTPTKMDLKDSINSRFRWIVNDEEIPEEHREEISMALGIKYVLSKSLKTLDQLQKEFKKENDLQSTQSEV